MVREVWSDSLEVHPATRGHLRHCRCCLRNLADHGLIGEYHGFNAGRILEGRSGYLNRVNDATFHHGTVFTEVGVVTVVISLLFDLVEDNCALEPGVLNNQL